MPSAAPNSDRIRVAMLITELEVGGAEQRFCDVACGLDREKFEPFVFSLGPPPAPPQDALLRRLQENQVPVDFANASGLRQVRQALVAVKEWLARIQPDVAQTFLFHANVLGGRAAARAGVPFSMGIRVADPRAWRSWLERRISRRAEKVICVSESVRRFAIQRGFAEGKLSVIPNGVPQFTMDGESLRAELAARHKIPLETNWLVVVGRLHEQKGIDWLVDQATEWMSPLSNTHLILVGAGPLESHLKASIQKQALEDRIHLLGWRTDALAYIAASDLLLLPSRWEGMPNVVMEAMALGKPVLCGQAEGVADLLGNQHQPQTAAFGELDLWKQRIESLCAQPELRAQLGDANAQQILKHFSASSMVRRFESLFQDMKKRR